MAILRKVVYEMGGGLCDIVSAWGVENRISMSLRGIKVGESPEGSQAGKEGTPGVWMRLHDDAAPGGKVPARWIISGSSNYRTLSI